MLRLKLLFSSKPCSYSKIRSILSHNDLPKQLPFSYFTLEIRKPTCECHASPVFIDFTHSDRLFSPPAKASRNGCLEGSFFLETGQKRLIPLLGMDSVQDRTAQIQCPFIEFRSTHEQRFVHLFIRPLEHTRGQRSLRPGGQTVHFLR